jgi:hypothetical protein
MLQTALYGCIEMYANRCGVAVDKTLSKDISMLLHSNQRGGGGKGGSIHVILKIHTVLGYCILKTAAGNGLNESVCPGYSRCLDILECCVRNNDYVLSGIDFKTVQNVIYYSNWYCGNSSESSNHRNAYNDLNKANRTVNSDISELQLSCILTCYRYIEKYVVESIDNGIKEGERVSKGLDNNAFEESSDDDFSDSDSDSDGDDDDKHDKTIENETSENQKLHLGAWYNSIKWKKKGYNILIVCNNFDSVTDMFMNLEDKVKNLKSKKRKDRLFRKCGNTVRAVMGFNHFKNKNNTFVNTSNSTPGRIIRAVDNEITPRHKSRLIDGNGDDNGHFSPTKISRDISTSQNASPTKHSRGLSNSPNTSPKTRMRSISHDSAGTQGSNHGIVEDDEETNLILDSTDEVQLTKDLKRWCEDALETDSLRAHKLGGLWNVVKRFVDRSEEKGVANELAAIGKELGSIKDLQVELVRVFGAEDKYSAQPADEAERWKEEVLDLPAISAKGEIDRNDYSLTLLALGKEQQVLARKIAPANLARRGTIGMVNQMMFTKRVGTMWKKSALGDAKDTGDSKEKQTTEKVIEGLAKRKQVLELELVGYLASSDPGRVLSKQQLDIIALSEENAEIKNMLLQELGASALEDDKNDKKSMFEKLKEENAMIRSLREEIRALKDEQTELEDKLKLVRKGKGDAEELLMSPEDREEMEENIKRLRRQVRLFQRAIKKCRDKWQDMKDKGAIPESAAAKKLREATLAASALKAFKRTSLLAAGGEAAAAGGGGAAGSLGAAVNKVKVLQFGFGNFGGGGAGLGRGLGGSLGGGLGGGLDGSGGVVGVSPKGPNRALAVNSNSSSPRQQQKKQLQPPQAIGGFAGALTLQKAVEQVKKSEAFMGRRGSIAEKFKASQRQIFAGAAKTTALSHSKQNALQSQFGSLSLGAGSSFSDV